MPVLTVNTNVSGDKIPKDFKKKATDIIAKSLGKPPAYIAVQVNPNQDISFGGTDEPAALCDLVSIGSLSVDANKKHSKAIMDYLHSSLGVSTSRMYISFKDTPKGDIGFQSTTFADFM